MSESEQSLHERAEAGNSSCLIKPLKASAHRAWKEGQGGAKYSNESCAAGVRLSHMNIMSFSVDKM